MTTLDITANAGLLANFTSALDFQTPNAKIDLSSLFRFTDGVGANQCNRIWADQRTLTASSTESLDLAGSLTDAFGSTITFARVKLLFVRAAAANTNDVLLGGAASFQFVNWVSDATDVVVVRPGGLLLLVDPGATGYAVTAGTGDILKVANSSSGSSVTYDIVIAGGAT